MNRTNRRVLSSCRDATLALALLCSCSESAAPPPSSQALAGADTAQARPPRIEVSAPIEFRGTCDGSAAAPLADGRIIVANDEDSVLRTYDRDGRRLLPDFDLASSLLLKDGEPDIEAAAVAGDRIYWITSHGRTKKAKRKDDRFRLFATAAGGQTRLIGRPYSGLMNAEHVEALGLKDAEPLAPEDGGINIEALAAADDGSLLLGFRSPLRGKVDAGRALIVPLVNAGALIGDAPEGANRPDPQFGTPIELDLGNRGIRDMVRFGTGYLLIAGNVSDTGGFDLFRWDGTAGGRPVQVASLDSLNAEALVNLGEDKVLVLSDEGDTELEQHGQTICKDVPDRSRSFKGRVYAISE